MFYLTTHSAHFIYGYMASDIWLRTILIVRKETRCRHIDYSYRLTARVLLYAPSHRQDNTYHGLCYTSRGALAGTRHILMSVESNQGYNMNYSGPLFNQTPVHGNLNIAIFSLFFLYTHAKWVVFHIRVLVTYPLWCTALVILLWTQWAWRVWTFESSWHC